MTVRKTLIGLLLATSIAIAGNYMTIACDGCSSSTTDIAEFGYSQAFGSRGWMAPEQGDAFFIRDVTNGALYFVDLSIVMSSIKINLIFVQ